MGSTATRLSILWIVSNNNLDALSSDAAKDAARSGIVVKHESLRDLDGKSIDDMSAKTLCVCVLARLYVRMVCLCFGIELKD